MDLYNMDLSPPCHSVRLLAKVLDLPLNLINLDLLKKEQMSPEFLKINPQHQIPNLIDGDLVLGESRAILAYLCEKYAKDDSLYPRDPSQRAVINQRLYFDMGTLYQRFSAHYYPQILHGKPVPEGTFGQFQEALGFLETFLGKTTYVAGDSLSIADFAIVASVTTFKVAAAVDLSGYVNIERWYALMANSVAGFDDICVQGSKQFAPLFANARQ